MEDLKEADVQGAIKVEVSGKENYSYILILGYMHFCPFQDGSTNPIFVSDAT
jgi:hypothetical protein